MDERDWTFTGVCCLPLIDGVGIALVQDAKGWRFSAWHRHPTMEPIRFQPAAADCELSFATPEDAAAYFASMYRARLTGDDGRA